jgi:glycine/D-amino acid oxidase-like deaminating enzyme
MISIWERESFYGKTDILIAGSGLMGLWTAFELKRLHPKLNITIAESQPIPALASTRNAGFACFGSPSEIYADIQQLGEDTVFAIFEMRFKGIEKIKSTFGAEAIGYDPCGGFEVFGKDENWQGAKLQEKLVQLNRGLSSITKLQNTFEDCSYLLDTNKLNDFKIMVGNRLEGGLHSGFLVQALQNALSRQGVRFLFGHSVENVFGEAGNLQAAVVTSTRRLSSIKCRCFLWATNAGLSKLQGMEDLIAPARGQVLVSPPIENLQLKGTFHFDEGFYYFRNIGNRLLLGGARNVALEEERTDHLEPTKRIRDALEDFIRKHIPQAAEALKAPGWMHWAGIMGMARHKHPFVTGIAPGIYAAFACNGMGVAVTPVLAETAAEQLTNALG